ncbi:ferredoxin [Amycolatopsis sp. YIM 10]|uniref:ferredoxin n=1 Tax=Amycolatopsis sp. YIM 10 TaxID=2653857 RepID=UPI001884636E
MSFFPPVIFRITVSSIAVRSLDTRADGDEGDSAADGTTVPPEREAIAQEAVASCPQGAIGLVE